MTSTENGGDDSVESTPDSIRHILDPAPMGQELQVHPVSMQQSALGTRLHLIPRALGRGDLPSPRKQKKSQDDTKSAQNATTASNGDWLDMLEKMFCPSTPEQTGWPLLSNRDVELQLEPRPIRVPTTTRAPFFGHGFHEV